MPFDPQTALRNTEIFSGLDDIALEAVSRLVNWRTYNKGAEVVSYKDTARDVREDNSALVEQMPTHMEIANRVNTHREAVIRELNELARLGLISQDKRVLTVTDVEALAELLSEEL